MTFKRVLVSIVMFACCNTPAFAQVSGAGFKIAIIDSGIVRTATLSNTSLLQGINTISFKTEGSFTGFQNEKRGIKFGGVFAVADKVTIAPMIMLLLEE